MSTKKLSKPAAKTIPANSKLKPASKPVAPAKRATPPQTAKLARKPVAAPIVSITPIPAVSPLRANSKQSKLLDLLSTDGATIPQMMELTGWQAHTVRATLSAVFRKRLKLNIECIPVPGSSSHLYRAVSSAAA